MFNNYGRMGTMPRRVVKPTRPLPSPFGAPMPQGPSMGIGDFMRNQVQQSQPMGGMTRGGALAGYAPQRYTPGQPATDPSEAYYAELLRGGPQMAQRAQMADQRLAQNRAMQHQSELARGGPQMALRARQADARSDWNRFQGAMQGYGMRTQWR